MPATRTAAALPILLAVLGLMLPSPAGVRAAAEADCPPDKELCLQAERSGGIDLKTGLARLDGNVLGVVRSRDLRFSSERLTAFREGDATWVRLVLEENVVLRQGSREVRSDQGVLEQDRIRLNGNVRIADGDLSLAGHEAVLYQAPPRTELRGQPDAPLTITLGRALLTEGARAAEAAGGGTAGAAGTAGAEADAVSTRLQAQRAVLHGEPLQVELQGDVQIAQSDSALSIEADRVALFFAAGDSLESFRAEGDVEIAQPNRRITADFAQSRNRMQSFRLVGHARLQQKGEFELESDRMEVHADARKGLLESQDRSKPIQLSLDLGGAGSTYRLHRGAMLTLAEADTPPTVLDKLAPLLDRTFETRSAFTDAVRARLSAEEARQHLDAIVAAAH